MTSPSTPTPANTTGPDSTILVYTGGARQETEDVLSVYADLRCPFCRRMELGLGAVMADLAVQGRFRLEYHFATFIDNAAGGSGSLHALSAVGAASDVGQEQSLRYIRALFASQPAEEDDLFADSDLLLRIADEIEGLRGPSFDRQVADGTYLPWARRVSGAFQTSGITGTPTVLLNGRPVSVLGPQGYAVTPEAFLAQLE
ncbi:DsbA family protein [Streptomyces rubiginosohelvolus]|uniref:DsbA family protein n=1 Tax=Streptomyces rubiginosohelvolus TaxID=67362 RepID=UPI00371C98E4